MVISLQAAAQKWARNAQAGILANWQSGVQRGVGNYCEGLARLGVNPAACSSGVGAHWQAGVSAVSPQEVASRVGQAAAADKWARRWLEVMNRGM